MSDERQLKQQDEKNPFADMGFIQFWVVSTIFWMTFPASLCLCYLTMGPIRTKQFVKALIHDFLQTILIILFEPLTSAFGGQRSAIFLL